MLPSDAMFGRDYTDVVPSKLESLVLTNCRNLIINVWIDNINLAEKPCFPNLHSVSVYYKYRVLAASLYFRIFMKRMDVVCKFSHLQVSIDV